MSTGLCQEGFDAIDAGLHGHDLLTQFGGLDVLGGGRCLHLLAECGGQNLGDPEAGINSRDLEGVFS